MKKYLRHWAVAATGVAAAFAISSCAYDPYYSGVGGSYSTGYGEGYGYGGSNFSTSVFVGTGDPRWGYDPYCYSYYDYRSRRYYDPYLYGYYPIGYRPPIIIGAPHPYGWRPGHGYCPPPRHVRNVTVVNYRNRETAYRNSDYGWAKQVRRADASRDRIQAQQLDRKSYNKPYSGSRPPGGNYNLQKQGSNPYSNQLKPSTREPHKAGYPQAYNKPVTNASVRQYNSGQQQAQFKKQNRQLPPPTIQGGNRGGKHLDQPANTRGKNPNGKGESKEEKKRGMRGLGQG